MRSTIRHETQQHDLHQFSRFYAAQRHQAIRAVTQYAYYRDLEATTCMETERNTLMRNFERIQKSLVTLWSNNLSSDCLQITVTPRLSSDQGEKLRVLVR